MDLYEEVKLYENMWESKDLSTNIATVFTEATRLRPADWNRREDWYLHNAP
jgi:hypothetical protein